MEKLWNGCATGSLQQGMDKIKIRFEDESKSDMIGTSSRLARLVCWLCWPCAARK